MDNLQEIFMLGEYTGYEITPPGERIGASKGTTWSPIKSSRRRDVMDACPELALVCIVATGMNNIDLDYAAKKGITVKNVAGYSTESVTQCTFASLFYLMNAGRYYDDYVKSGKYAGSAIFTHLGH